VGDGVGANNTKQGFKKAKGTKSNNRQNALPQGQKGQQPKPQKIEQTRGRSERNRRK
jgi:hypothetical protein